MKRYIKNKVYDTETARLIGGKMNGLPGDLLYSNEKLYQKKTGEFFMYGEGGANTKYAKPIGPDSWCSGEKIIPISFSEAQKWAKENLSDEEYDATFKVVVDDSKRVQMGINVSSTVADKLRKRSTELGMSISGWIEYLVNNAD